MYAPEVCGPFAWAMLHSWAENIEREICPTCGAFAVKAAKALHDVVNVKLGKPVAFHDNLDDFAEIYRMAARNESFEGAAAKLLDGLDHTLAHGAKEHDHMRPDVRHVDFTDNQPITETLTDTPEMFDAFKVDARDDGKHGDVLGCPAGKFDGVSCSVEPKLVAVLHPETEGRLLEEEAVRRDVPIHANGMAAITPPQLLQFIQGALV